MRNKIFKNRFHKEKLNIIPYIIVDGIPSLPNSYIAGLYDQMLSDGTLQKYFYTRDLNIFKRDNFVYLAKKSGFIAVEYENKPAAFVLLENFRKGISFINFCTFKWTRIGYPDGTRLTVCGAIETLNYLFKFYNTLLAIIPVTNTISIKFSKRLGFKKIGELTQICYQQNINKYENAVLLELNKENFNYAYI